MSWVDTFRRVPVTWTTTKSVDRVVVGLRHAGLRGPGELIGPTGPLGGKVRPPRVVARRRSGFNNSLAAVLVARLSPDGSGAVLTGRLGPNPFGVAFLILWIGGATAFPWIASAGRANGLPPTPLWLTFPLFGVGIIAIGGRAAARDRAVIRSTIAEALGGPGSDTADGSPPSPSAADEPGRPDPTDPPVRRVRTGPYTSSPSTGEGPPT